MNTFYKVLKYMVLACIIVIVGGFALSGFDVDAFKTLYTSDKDFTEVSQNSTGSFTKIEIDCQNKSVVFLPSEDDNFYINYYVSDNHPVSFTDEDGVISIKSDIVIPFTINLIFNFQSSKINTITIKMPQSFNGDIDIVTKNGRMEIEGFNLNSISFKTSNGGLTAKAITAQSFSFESKNGSAVLNDINSPEISLNTSNGGLNAKGIVSDKFYFKTSNGKAVIKEILCRDIEVVSTNGSLDVSVLGEKIDYDINLATKNGSIHVDGTKISSQIISGSGDKSLKAHTTNGSITIKFE